MHRAQADEFQNLSLAILNSPAVYFLVLFHIPRSDLCYDGNSLVQDPGPEKSGFGYRVPRDFQHQHPVLLRMIIPDKHLKESLQKFHRRTHNDRASGEPEAPCKLQQIRVLLDTIRTSHTHPQSHLRDLHFCLSRLEPT